MRLVSFERDGKAALGIREGEEVRVIGSETLESLLARGVDLVGYAREHASQERVPVSQIRFLPPLSRPPKIICVGLNFSDHTSESKYEQPDYPTLFFRVATSLIAHDQPMIRPRVTDSDGLDYEGEIAVVIGKGGRHISKDAALSHVAGYSVFNDGSVREYQFKTPQWTVGKNFDGTGAFGPDLVTADELPPGVKGLQLETRLNGEVVQSASTDEMVFDVASLISIISEAITLEAGDVIVSGTPSGIGWARSPKLLMKAGDVCEVSVEKIGTLRNVIADESAE
ncbi:MULTISPECIES: fumarylacetoacetate hydrolase family protein [Paraburkholderia]|jgi:2-keto-4-pentenoate hydratase/2-oxohepta-3-ene-1,7-dioic acid hydratase in catechol pathway|uniref:FAA hydrolase family protein n=1 Tax=Paraburkholderia hospita TaxID=169430 RepID=A0AAN1MIG5_9BURK|nr:fumarylacetoacetate hydrolase family protein [Paraburkholderia hospita]AUT68288.1 FAA hydrolase family protein [Paraburkholderia hospita]SEI21741.1 2-keto-4-pentenoate hydratase/2-oxohepta-3-ene-1,7-dioic acid hydratase (catechol pathway) [Paraburkholderia hospita]SKC72227.1 2-keto-4-pentenoate hydratase/2-oxohepta-3-ene-1,7-dioic acid hydratase (catechol pathway) [Paraburkholderia hospita]SOE69544.1 2-keto-4-pentenoate hydratase/2-oxohepta-3-ene-1,7-dioic acid hydratase (catechol pathway) [